MKKSLYRIFAIAAVVIMMAGCKVEEIALGPVPATVSKSFSAVFESQTRTSIEMDGTTGKVKWVAGDAISILDGVNNIKVVLTAENITEGGSKAVFTADVATSETYYAVYPYSTENRLEEGQPVTVKPSTKQDGTFGCGHVSLGQYSASDASFTFSSVVSVLKFSQTSTDIAKVVFAVKGASERLFDGVSSVEVTTGAAGTYYFCLPAVSLSDGFTVTALDASGNATKMAYNSSAFAAEAGKGYNLGTLEDHYNTVLSIAEFKALSKSDKTKYIVSGSITGVEETTYGDFYITDGTDSLYIYGLLTPEGTSKKQYTAAGLKEGDHLTIYGARSTYNGLIQMKNAIYITHREASYNYLLSQNEYGAYSEFKNASVCLFSQYEDQIAVGSGNFRFVNPNSSKWFSVTGLPRSVSTGCGYTVTVSQNYTSALPSSASKSVTVDKVEDDPMTGATSTKKVWMHSSDGTGYIIRMFFDETK